MQCFFNFPRNVLRHGNEANSKLRKKQFITNRFQIYEFSKCYLFQSEKSVIFLIFSKTYGDIQTIKALNWVRNNSINRYEILKSKKTISFNPVKKKKKSFFQFLQNRLELSKWYILFKQTLFKRSLSNSWAHKGLFLSIWENCFFYPFLKIIPSITEFIIQQFILNIFVSFNRRCFLIGH